MSRCGAGVSVLPTPWGFAFGRQRSSHTLSLPDMPAHPSDSRPGYVLHTAQGWFPSKMFAHTTRVILCQCLYNRCKAFLLFLLWKTNAVHSAWRAIVSVFIWFKECWCNAINGLLAPCGLVVCNSVTGASKKRLLRGLYMYIVTEVVPNIVMKVWGTGNEKWQLATRCGATFGFETPCCVVSSRCATLCLIYCYDADVIRTITSIMGL